MKPASSEPTKQKVLLADIGGTNARFALLAGGTVSLYALAEVGGIG
jgi:glucokinase